MTKRVTLPAGGLATDPNPYITASQGAMRRADDVVFRHEGVASLRPGFETVTTKSTDRRPRAMTVYGGNVVLVSVDGSTWSCETALTVHDSDSRPPNTDIAPTSFAQMRGNLYLTTYSNVRKMTASNVAPVAAGLQECATINVSKADGVAPEPLAIGYSYAYRVCITRRDANGVELRSAPSPWAWTTNTAGDTRRGVISVPLEGYSAGDVVEVYRSLGVNSGRPSDILFLAAKHVVTSGNIAAGYVSIDDHTLEEQLGAELYTNSTREGILKSNTPPPVAVSLCSFESCLWYANTTERHTLAFRVQRVDMTSTPSLGLSFARTTASGTIATNTLTVASAAGLHTGMYVYDDAGDPSSAGTNIPADTVILTIVGTTVTLSKNLLASPVGATFNFSDRITVASSDFYTTGTGGPTMSVGGKFVFLTGATATDIGAFARDLALIVTLRTGGPTVYAMGIEELTLAGTVIVRRTTNVLGSFVVTTTAPTGALVSSRGDANLDSSQDAKPNRIYYSKPDEPEHVPPINYLSIGDESHIIGMAKSRHALIVFKENGCVYRVTGSAPDGWRVDEIDSATRLHRGSCLAESNGLVYAWTSRGFVVASEAGVRSISARHISRELDEYTQYMTLIPTTAGAFVTSWPAQGLVLFGVPWEDGATETTHLYCFSEATSRWSRWELDAYCMGSDTESDAVYVARSGMWSLGRNVGPLMSTGTAGVQTYGYDRTFSLSGWTYTAGTTTVSVSDAQRGSWTPVAGDWIGCTVGGATHEQRRIETAIDAGASYTLTISAAFSAGVQTALLAFEAIQPHIEWQPHTVGGDPFAMALWSEAQVALDTSGDQASKGSNLGADAIFFLGGLSERDRDSTEAVPAYKRVTYSRATDQSPNRRRRTLRAGLDKEIGRAAECAPYLAGSNLGLPWHCLGVTLKYAPYGGDGERTAR